MEVITGEKLVRRFQGYVVDFCPMCRGLQQFKIFKIFLVKHVYFIGYGRGDFQGCLGKCKGCNVEIERNACTYKDFVGLFSKKFSMEQMIEKTFPNIGDYYRHRLQIEQQIASGNSNLAQDLRLELILEPFELLSPRVDEALRHIRIDIWVILTVAAAVVAVLYHERFADHFQIYSDARINLLLAVIGVGTLLSFLSLELAARRYVKEIVYTRIAKTLVPLKPATQELAEVFSAMSLYNYKITRKGSLQALTRAIRRQEKRKL